MVYHYAAIGDSLTVGFGAMPGNGFVPVYRRMAEHHLKTFVAHDNMGVNGLTSHELNHALSSNAMMRRQIQQADIVTISIGGNDLIRAAKSSPGMISAHQLNAALGQCKSNFARILNTVQELKHSGKPCIIRAVGLYNPYPHIQEATQWVQQFNSYINSFNSQSYGVANIYHAFNSRERPVFSIDRLHPNGKGYRIIAEKLDQLGYWPLG